MKRIATLLAFGVLGAGAAQAQSNVRLYGFMDTSVASIKGGDTSQTRMRSGDLVATRFGISGSEDLGGGNKLNFQLEAGFNGATGAGAVGGGLAFNRHAWLGVQGGWGEVRLGRTFNSTMRQLMHYDPFFGGGLAASQAAVSSLAIYQNPQTGLRHTNQIEYWLPQSSPVTGQLMYSMREDGIEGYGGGRLAYKAGPLDVGVGYAQYHHAVVERINEASLGAKYSVGNADLFAMVSRSSNARHFKQNGWHIGASLRQQAFEYAVSYSASETEGAGGVPAGKSDKLAGMVRYHLSKRTSVYGLAIYVDNADGAASAPLGSLTAAQVGANNSSRGLSFGLVHAF
jgi:predicted porin